MHASSRRSFLRERTAQAHSLVDSAVGAFDSVAAYGRYARGLYVFRAPLEAQLTHGAWPECFGGWRPYALAGALRDDLADLGMSPSIAAGHAVDCEPPGAPADAAELLGKLYVLEGSALGANVLYRRALALGLRDDFGARHLAQQVSGGDRWRRFLALLESVAPLDTERLARAAESTFTAAQHAFSAEAALSPASVAQLGLARPGTLA